MINHDGRAKRAKAAILLVLLVVIAIWAASMWAIVHFIVKYW